MIDKTLVSAYYKGGDPFAMFAKTDWAQTPDDLFDKDVLILWGGEDISPAIYGQEVKNARAGAKPSSRDIIESALFRRAVDDGIPIIGVCRGAQLACALSGGTVYQHIEHGHHQDHAVETMDGHTYFTSSCHHQALNLEGTKHELLAWDKGRKIKAFTDTDVPTEVVIPEVVFFPDTKCLAIQGHPEWMSPSSPFVQWLGKQIQTKLL